jgi:hypothetical protein
MLARLATVIAQFPPLPSPGNGSQGFQRMMTIFGILMGAGFVIGIAGHMTRSKALILAGVLLIFGATGIFLVAVATHG